jgi:hypothetical protein
MARSHIDPGFASARRSRIGGNGEIASVIKVTNGTQALAGGVACVRKPGW